jgi:3-hydroxybutyryl-CoA dehydrogenase
MKIETIGVVGSGTMGNGIAHTAAQSGRRVLLVDVEAPLLSRAIGTIDRTSSAVSTRKDERGRRRPRSSGASRPRPTSRA